jgi:hypothetical protein
MPNENARLWLTAMVLWLIVTMLLGWGYWKVWTSLEALL